MVTKMRKMVEIQVFFFNKLLYDKWLMVNGK